MRTKAGKGFLHDFKDRNEENADRFDKKHK